MLLAKLIKMMIITYIMGHTLTISEETSWSVASAIQHSWRPDRFPQHTSPKLANRQLKFFFSILRNQVYENVLNWQQQTLHSSGKKDQTWLPAFCVMLGFAMVLEEVQLTMYLQADAKAQKPGVSQAEADTEAHNACGRIDDRFNLLVGLFQCKYRAREWTTGSFGPQTPLLPDPVQHRFCQDILGLVLEKSKSARTREGYGISG